MSGQTPMAISSVSSTIVPSKLAALRRVAPPGILVILLHTVAREDPMTRRVLLRDLPTPEATPGAIEATRTALLMSSLPPAVGGKTTTLLKVPVPWHLKPANLNQEPIAVVAEVPQEAVLEVGAADTVAVITNLRRPTLSA